MANPPLAIIQDSREQFDPAWSEGVTVERTKLEFGDYSAVGLTEVVALEVKWSLDDLAACVGRERERFDTMLRGLARFPMRALIVAGESAAVGAKLYVSRVNPKAIIASTWAWAADYQISTIWARDKHGATRAIEWWLRRAVEKHGKAAA